jgi:hypothetical protein
MFRWLWSLRILTQALLAVILLAACLPPLPPVQDESLIDDGACAPPCWQGAVPGQTSTEEAGQILRSLSFVDPQTIERSELGRGRESMHWLYRGEPGIRTGGRMVFETGKLVYTEVDTPRLIPLSEIVHRYGEPQFYAVDHWPDGRRHAYLYYFDRGMLVVGQLKLLATRVPSNEEPYEVELSPELKVWMVRYFPPGDIVNYDVRVNGMSTAEAGRQYIRLTPWPGMGERVKVGN